MFFLEFLYIFFSGEWNNCFSFFRQCIRRLFLNFVISLMTNNRIVRCNCKLILLESSSHETLYSFFFALIYLNFFTLKCCPNKKKLSVYSAKSFQTTSTPPNQSRKPHSVLQVSTEIVRLWTRGWFVLIEAIFFS